MNTEDLTQKVINALEDDKYKWRTIRGVADSTGFSEEEVLSVINENESLIVRASVSSRSGEALYTTRRHYKEHGELLGKIFGAFKGRAR